MAQDAIYASVYEFPFIWIPHALNWELIICKRIPHLLFLFYSCSYSQSLKEC